MRSFRFVYRNFHTTSFLQAKRPFLLADIGEGISEVEIIQWFVKKGDKVAEFDRICEVQSDKAAVEISSRFEGTITKMFYEPGDIAKVGSPLIEIDAVDEEEVSVAQDTQVEPQKSIVEEQVSPSKDHGQITSASKKFATPAVRRIAKESNIDISHVQGTGPNDRVLKGDILAFISGGSQKPESVAQPMAAAALPTDQLVKLTAIQKAMFKSMTKSLQIPHFGFSDEIVMNNAFEMRKEINHNLSSKGQKISLMPIFLKTLSIALSEFPILNSKVEELDGVPMLRYRSQHNIGIAMDTKQGLLVPIVKNVEKKSILDIANDLEELKSKGQAGTLSNTDLSGGTFTLSNVGNIGGTVLHPVLVNTEVCIGAIGKVQKLPRYLGDKLVALDILNCSFNADHRVIDGATVAKFVQKWKSLLESNSLLIAHLK